MLKLRPIGPGAYSVFESEQRIGRIRFVIERVPGVWLWNVNVHLTGGLPMGSSKDVDTAKPEFKAAWEALKARTRAGGSRGGLRGDEHQGRRLTRTGHLYSLLYNRGLLPRPCESASAWRAGFVKSCEGGFG